MADSMQMFLRRLSGLLRCSNLWKTVITWGDDNVLERLNVCDSGENLRPELSNRRVSSLSVYPEHTPEKYKQVTSYCTILF